MNRPRLLPGLEFYWEAFHDLSSCRVMGGAIPWSALDRWAEREEVEGDDFRRLSRLVSAMDAEYLRIREEERERERKRRGGNLK
jgi:hypothetical protein